MGTTQSVILQSKEDEEVCVEDKNPELDGPSKSKKGRHQLRVLQNMHYLKKWNLLCYPKLILEGMNVTKGNRAKEKLKKKDLNSEDVFLFQALAFDLKQLPYYERCMAKHEMRNVLYNHQMSVMEQQMQLYNAYQNQNQSSMHPPATPAGNSRMINPMQSSWTNSFASPPHTTMPQSQNSW